MNKHIKLIAAAAALAILPFATGCSVQFGSDSVPWVTDRIHGEALPVDFDLPADARSVRLEMERGVGRIRLDGTGTSALGGQVAYFRHAPNVSTRLSGSEFVIDIPEERVTRIGGNFDMPDTVLHLGADVPTTIHIQSGVGEMDLDLTTVPVRRLIVKEGVGSKTVRVDRSTSVKVRMETGIGSHNLDAEGFTKRGGVWYSPDFTEGDDVLEIEIETGIGEFYLDRM